MSKKIFTKIGIIGGGQLGKMTAIAAANLGCEVHIYCPDYDSPAFSVANEYVKASYNDHQALMEFAKSVDVVTFEFENIPYESVKILEENVVVRPNWQSLFITQNRIREKSFVNELGIETAKFYPISCKIDLVKYIESLDYKAILKTAEMGYDGKGQYLIKDKNSYLEALNILPDINSDEVNNKWILEELVEFEKEVSIIAARNEEGVTVVFPIPENKHEKGILKYSIVPTDISVEMKNIAEEAVRKITEKMDLIGLLAVEFFITKDNRLLVNEMAPRPHNSGHWSIDACYTSQFEQFVRAITNLPFGSVRLHSKAIMENLIGKEILQIDEISKEPNAKLHVYGKKQIKKGRKMGHITRLYEL